MKTKKFTAIVDLKDGKGMRHLTDCDYTSKKNFTTDLRKNGYKVLAILTDEEIYYMFYGAMISSMNDEDYQTVLEKHSYVERLNWDIWLYVKETINMPMTKEDKEKYEAYEKREEENTKISAIEEHQQSEANNTELSTSEEHQQSKTNSTKKSEKSGEIICKIDILSELKKNGYNPSRIRKEKLIAECTLTELRKGIIRKMETLAIICSITGLNVSDIIEFKHTENSAPEEC